MAQNGRLSAVRRRAIACLLSERDVRSAARVSGVAERTLWRWLSEPVFKAALADAQAELDAATARRLSALQATAVETLEGALLSLLAEWPAKIRAADLILTHRRQAQDHDELAARIAALEEERQARSAAQGGGGHGIA